MDLFEFDVITMEKEKVAVIADNSTCTGFRLAGVENTFVMTGKEAQDKLSEMLSDPTFGIIIVTEKLVEEGDWRLKRKIEATTKPVVVAIPDIAGPIEQEESLAKLIKRALGVDLIKK